MSGDPVSPRVELATLQQKPILDELFQPYAREFSEIHPVEFGADGRFHYPYLDAYWHDPARFPFLVMLDQQAVGFVFVQQGSQISKSPSVWDMAEFFIERAHRRHGIGTAIAHTVWTRFPGSWEVRVMGSNKDALMFWSAAAHNFAGPVEPISMEKNGEAWCVFQFETRTKC